MSFLGMVPKMTPPCEVITELWFSKQPFQHHRAQHKTFQWNHRLISTAGDSIWFCIIYWLQNSILFSEQHFSHRRRPKTHLYILTSIAEVAQTFTGLFCVNAISELALGSKTQQTFSESQKILTEHIVVSHFSVKFTEG